MFTVLTSVVVVSSDTGIQLKKINSVSITVLCFTSCFKFLLYLYFGNFFQFQFQFSVFFRSFLYQFQLQFSFYVSKFI